MQREFYSPLVAPFRPIKAAWKEEVLRWRRDNPCMALTKDKFAPLLNSVVKKIKSETLVNGFCACGLYPIDPNAIDYAKCLGKSNINYQNQQKEQFSEQLSYNAFCQIVGKKHIVTRRR